MYLEVVWPRRQSYCFDPLWLQKATKGKEESSHKIMTTNDGALQYSYITT